MGFGGSVKYIVWLLLILAGSSYIQAGDYVKYVRQIYAVNAETNCLMDFKFSRVVLKQWEEDSILVEASFRVKGVEEWEKEGLAEQLAFRLQSWPGVWKLYLEIAPEFNREGDLIAEISVWVPEKVTLDLINRYGNIYLPDYYAKLPTSFTTIYGNIEADTIQSLPDAEVRLNVSYGKLEVKKCEKANVRSSYSSVGMKSARFLQIKAEKSYLILQDADTVISEGKYNRYEVK